MKVICIFAYVTYLIIRAQGGWQKFLLVRNTKWQKWVFGGGMKAFGLRELNSRSTSNHSAFHAAQPLLLPSSFLFFSWLLSRPSLLTRLRSPSEPLLPSSRPFSESCLSQLVSEMTEHLSAPGAPLFLGCQSSLTGRPLLLIAILETTL